MRVFHRHFDPERFFRRVFYVVLAAGVGIASVAGSIDWEKFEPSAAVVLPLAWAIIRAGAGWYKAEFSVNPNGWFWKLVCITLIAGVGLAGCASSNQTLRTADGDEYRRRGISLLSKQEAEGKANLVAYPNGSGLEFQIGDSASQDTAALVPVITAVVQAVMAGGGFGSAPVATPQENTSVISRLNQTLSELAELRASIEAMRLGL